MILNEASIFSLSVTTLIVLIIAITSKNVGAFLFGVLAIDFSVILFYFWDKQTQTKQKRKRE